MLDLEPHLVRIEADASAGLLPRVTGILARRGIVPQMVRASKIGEAIFIELRMDGLDETVLRPLIGNFWQMVEVRAVELG